MNSNEESTEEFAFHYTDKKGWNAIRSQLEWKLLAIQPKHSERPVGASFTNIEPTRQNLKTLCKRLRIPKAKQEYVFWFTERTGLIQHNDGHGRDKFIFYSPVEYHVEKGRQKYGDLAEDLLEQE